MKNNRTCKVVMLPTEKQDDVIIKHRVGTLSYVATREAYFKSDNWTAQHLYFISDEEIKEGDWFYHPKGVIFPATAAYMKGPVSTGLMRKIIATTDSLGLSPFGGQDIMEVPKIPQSFVEAYVKANGKIDEVQVEFEYVPGNRSTGRPLPDGTEPSNETFRLKLRDDNTVIVHQARSYTLDDMRKAFVAGMKWESMEAGVPFDKWIEENL